MDNNFIFVEILKYKYYEKGIIDLLLCFPAISQVGIGTESPHASSILDVESTTKGFLPPRMANTSGISSPATGLMIYNTTDNCIQVNIGTPSSPNWQCMSSGSGGNSGGGSGTSSISDATYHAMGGTDLRFKSFRITYARAHSFGITTNDDLFIWGTEHNGYVASNFNLAGRQSYGNMPSPYKLNHPDIDGKVKRVDHKQNVYLILTTDNKLFATGYNGYNLMDNNAGNFNNTMEVFEIGMPAGSQATENIVDMRMIGPHAYMIITSEGKAYWRGWMNASNQSTTFASIPTPPGAPPGFTYKEIMHFDNYAVHTIFLKGSDEEIYGFGFNGTSTNASNTNLGNSAYLNQDYFPTSSSNIVKLNLPPGHANVKSLYFEGTGTSTVILEDGKVYAWGMIFTTYSGQVFKTVPVIDETLLTNSSGTFYTRDPIEVKIPAGETAKKIFRRADSGGGAYSLLFTESGKLYLCGRLAQTAYLKDIIIANGSSQDDWVEITYPIFTDVKDITLGYGSLKYIDNDGRYFWRGYSAEKLNGGTINEVSAPSHAAGVLGYNRCSLCPLLRGDLDPANANLQPVN
jgi:alpha-tubulin suppressor-like RCC1 family protein